MQLIFIALTLFSFSAAFARPWLVKDNAKFQQECIKREGRDRAFLTKGLISLEDYCKCLNGKFKNKYTYNEYENNYSDLLSEHLIYSGECQCQLADPTTEFGKICQKDRELKKLRAQGLVIKSGWSIENIKK